MSKWTVEFLNDSVEAEFDNLPPQVRAKAVQISKLIVEFGPAGLGMPYIRHVQDKIWEIRASHGRCLYISATGRKVVILRCFVKKSNKLPKKELKIAFERAREIDNG
ncbi:protein of unknown function DUF891 [Desulfonatronospira thiodismutans ASO3-1]|uniref:Type II toxin-antitoxin system RelE/ParE family toxin n=1 Tax=Desulfonatronospira thiodismutans ASO3-1 TaxID=555779 RepID=D6SUX3_9BACT|nr:type II toxin-antitoxin system RelE/ParE family toxin [Desulfonatronospira thiodismutans]EFI32729.1 protein of unknown function DUF891 [Desulfonatronospira thiodismutans ASO3-1]